MKLRKFKYIFLFAATLSMSSCLDLDPQDQLGGDKMWQTTDDFKNFANNFYGWTPDFSSLYEGGSISSEAYSDCWMPSKGANVVSRGTNTLPTGDGDYTGNYDKIRRTNLLLQNAESFGNKDGIKTYVGEAYFFRAWSYFNLLRKFGDAIILTKPIDVTDPAMNSKRNDRSEVADFIVSDLQKAVEYLPEIGTDAQGRLCKATANAFLSRVALYEGTWQKYHKNDTERAKSLLDISAKAAEAVMNTGRYYLFGTDGASKALGTQAYRYMFNLEDEKSNPAGVKKADNHEYIFVRHHDPTLSVIGKNITTEKVNNVELVTYNFVRLFLCQDGLPIEKSKVYKGDKNIIDEYTNRDNRMSNILLVPGQKYWTNQKPRTSWDDNDLATALPYDGMRGSGYNNQKWGTERKISKDGQEAYDFPIIRYAEVLLNYAEAVYERDGQISDADLDKSLNLVRLRVNPDMPKLSNSLVSANGLSMQEEIRRERTIELYDENFRTDDLKRWNTAVQELSKPLLGIKYKGTEYEKKWVTNKPSYQLDADGRLILDNERKWSEKNYLFPLPSDQTQLNPNIGQNPGWGK